MKMQDYIPPVRELRFLPGAFPPAFSRRVLEVGPGKGEFILNEAAQSPSTLFVGLEIKKGRFERIAEKAQKLELKNLFMVRGDARECLPRLFAPASLDRVYVLFPDPWPKLRHTKHRLLKPRVVRQLHDLLKAGGEVYSATDAGFYSEQIVAAFAEAGGFGCEAIESLYPTYFETKWKKLGRKIDYWKFKKI